MEKAKTKNQKMVIILISVIVILLLGGGFLVYTLTNNMPKSNQEEKPNQNEQLPGDENKYYNLDSIKNIIVEVPKLNTEAPEMVSKIIENKDEIKNILSNIDGASKIDIIPDGIGFESTASITIEYNGNPSTKIIVLNNGNIAMNLALGAGESGYAEYSIKNKNFNKELINKYQ